MDTHEKLGNLLSQYLSSANAESDIPSDILNAFHKMNLTEFASRQNVEEMYRNKKSVIEKEYQASGMSNFARQYADQQIKELDEAFALIMKWLDR